MKRNYGKRLKYGTKRTYKKGSGEAREEPRYTRFGLKMKKAHKAWKRRDESALRELRPGWLSGPKRISNPRRRRKGRRKAARSYSWTKAMLYSGPARRRNSKPEIETFAKFLYRKMARQYGEAEGRRRYEKIEQDYIRKYGIGKARHILTRPSHKSVRRNPLPRWVDRRSIRTIFRGKGKKRRRLLVGCPKGSWRRGRCRKGMRLVEKKRA